MSTDLTNLDAITTNFLSVLQHKSNDIYHTSSALFYYLVLIQLCITIFQMILTGEELNKFFVKLIHIAVNSSMFYFLMQHAHEWIPKFVDGLIFTANHDFSSLSPTDIFSQGLKIIKSIFNNVSYYGLVTHPMIAITTGILTIFIIAIYALISAEMTIIIAKMYIILALSSLFFACGSNDYTKSLAHNYVRAVVGLALNLMTVYLILSIFSDFMVMWQDSLAQSHQSYDLMPIFMIAGMVIVHYLLIKNVPPFIAGLSGAGGFNNNGMLNMLSTANMANNLSRGMLKSGTQGLKSGAVNAAKSTSNVAKAVSTKVASTLNKKN